MSNSLRTQRISYRRLLLLLVIGIVQVEWWHFDNRSFSEDVEQELTAAYEQQADVLSRVAEQENLTPSAVAALSPTLSIVDGTICPDPAIIESLKQRTDSRINQYAWESAFFLVVLVGCIAILARTFRDEVRLVRTKDTFLATVSHEFRTPLASMRLAMETVQMRQPEGEARETLLRRMNADLHRMEVLVSNVLDASRMACGRLELSTQPLALAPLLEEAVERAERGLPDGVPPVDVEMPGHITVQADEMAVSTAVGNVLENALKAVSHTPGCQSRVKARRSALPSRIPASASKQTNRISCLRSSAKVWMTRASNNRAQALACTSPVGCSI